MEHRARKRFGQNFLQDPGIIDRIVTAIRPTTNDHLVEIGPGTGALTAPLMAACPSLQVIEIDRDLIPGLLAQFANYPDFKLHKQDALTVNFAELAGNTLIRIVGNLPYNISTPLIFHLLNFYQHIDDMHFMLQKEVVQRLAARANDKHYGRLSVMMQYHCEVEALFEVAPECFNPKPKVDSAIVRLIPHQNLPVVAHDTQLFAQVVTAAFQQRRKTLANSLKNILEKEQIQNLPVDTKLRAENLSLQDYVNISNCIDRQDLALKPT